MATFGLLTPSEIALELGKRLQNHRLQQNKTQAQLAQHIGVSTPTISNLENGKNTTLDTFIHVILALGLIKELETLFDPPPLTIAQLEKLQQPTRQRASMPRAPTPSTQTPHGLESILNTFALTNKGKTND